MSKNSTDAVKVLAHAKRIAVLTGAGISAESGIPTFRGKDGIWKKMKPEKLACMDAFLKDPKLVWEWYEYRRKIVLNALPNAAHETLADMERSFEHMSISTQNVDGLHCRAGSSNVVELHGNILRNRCNVCGQLFYEINHNSDSFKCECGGLIRPDVVWFGEKLPFDALEKSFDDARNAQVYFSIGTAAAVYPAAQLPFEALQSGAYLIEINVTDTPLTPHVHKNFYGPAANVLPELWRAVLKEKAKLN